MGSAHYCKKKKRQEKKKKFTFLGNHQLTNLFLPVTDGVIFFVEPSAITNHHAVVSTLNIPQSFFYDG